jgi:hypothetical protein
LTATGLFTRIKTKLIAFFGCVDCHVSTSSTSTQATPSTVDVSPPPSPSLAVVISDQTSDLLSIGTPLSARPSEEQDFSPILDIE